MALAVAVAPGLRAAIGGPSLHSKSIARCRGGAPRLAGSTSARSAAGRTGRQALRVAATAAPPAHVTDEEVLSTSRFDDAGLTMHVVKRSHGDAGVTYSMEVSMDHPRPGCVLHWAVNDWLLPARESWPAGTNQAGDKAVQSPLRDDRHLTVTFPEATCPQRIVFVLKEGEQWTNSGGGDFVAHLKPPGAEEVFEKILVAESEYTHWSLFNRLVMAAQLLDAADAAGPPGMGFFFTWLRLSTMRQLDWYRNSNYQSKDIAHVQKHIAERMAHKARSAKDPLCRLFARLALAGLPRGGGNGDDIRMGILHIMRANGIREGHRPGIEDHFLEQWHQKLHTNTTPEDVTICEAYLAFLHSNDMGEFWRVAWERGQITPETLASMDHPITAHPLHLPHLIDPFKHYLWILKTTHSGADLDTSYTMAQGLMDGDLAWNIGDMLANRNEWWVPGKIVEVRHRLKGYWQAEGASRDLLLLDIALDGYFRVLVERMDKGAMQGDDLINLVVLVLDNASVSSESQELRQCLDLWRRIQEGGGAERWSRDWALLALAAADNTALCLEHYCDALAQLTQPAAEAFGARCSSVDRAYVANFGEEVVRSQPVFMLSVLLRFLDPMLRGAAGVGSWQVVSQGRAAAEGQLVVMPNLDGVQGQRFERAQVVVAEKLTGNEDIPEGIVAILTSSPTDVLSHIAIRARAQGVLLATCFDAAELEGIERMAGSHVSATVTPTGGVTVATAEASAAGGGAAGGRGGAAPRMQLERPKAAWGSGAWVLGEREFGPGLVGGKSANLAALRSKLPQGVQAPASIALPFGTFERVLAADCNRSVAAAVAAEERSAASAAAGAEVPPALAALRFTIAADLKAPAGFAQELAAAAAQAGLIASPADWAEGSAGWAAAWKAICQVWASKWNDRAWLSRRAQGVPDADLYMAVLLQQVVPAQYAFVLHTADPLTGERGELHGELVVGMGEALVGNYPGRALSFAASLGGGGNCGGAEPRLLSLPGKREGLFATSGMPHLIARSDSNGEDLEAFAGAGLYDSVPFPALEHRAIAYAGEPLLWDPAQRQQMLRELAQLGAAVEAAFGGVPQDIEGVRTADGGCEERLEIVSELLEAALACGLDAEWRPEETTGEQRGGGPPHATLVQLALWLPPGSPTLPPELCGFGSSSPPSTGSAWCLVLLLDFLALPPAAVKRALQQLFRNKQCLKLGFGLVHDLRAIAAALGGEGGSCIAVVEPACDLGSVHRFLRHRHVPGVHKAVDLGLSGLVEAQLGRPLDKTLQCSAWGKRPLSAAQQQYAAADAACLLALLGSLIAAVRQPEEWPMRQPTGPPRFLCDVMAEGLARQLRLCGFDTESLQATMEKAPRHAIYRAMVERAEAEQRVVLTRDRTFVQANYSDQAYLVQRDTKREQLEEVIEAFKLRVEEEEVLTRCARCNGEFVPEPLPPSLLPEGHGVPPGILATVDEYWVCGRCSGVYWQGSQYGRAKKEMNELIAKLKALA
ncbi:Carbohydrate-Binding Module Family 45 [Chlorella sorokiniana]|uniref:Carbohydrate-Binding Module Family 45 n=1 Tax=Chlorella sorokiniana TaxID=3076 RepID=A0A2P6TM61_CHLSO|nr:Carbohydrate-Binding Module Family 45 [Chlorella sorokiniana]|eukprot:PRW45423.1 Carbohydrate-Binding Module Family 45 [Chlorella sorokiniana]